MENKNVSTANNDQFLKLIRKWRLIQQPGPNHAMFKQMEGKWKVRLIFYGGGKKWETECISKNELLHGGRFLSEQVSGEIYAPDESGTMLPEPYSSTRILGYDNYKKAYMGSFVENQNSYMLNFIGRKPLKGGSDQIEFFGLSDEPMLGINDTTMKYVLKIGNSNNYKWEVYALALSDNGLVFEFFFTKAG